MSMHYCKENGRYTLYQQDVPKFDCDELGLLIDTEALVLFRHGPVDYVQREFAEMHYLFSQDPVLQRQANALDVISGHFDVEDINRALVDAHHVRTLYMHAQRFAEQKANEVLQRIRKLPV